MRIVVLVIHQELYFYFTYIIYNIEYILVWRTHIDIVLTNNNMNISTLRIFVSLILPLSQNVRPLRFSQKSIFYKFDQVYTKKYEYLQYQMDILRNYTFW
jgi:hypothetical protein